MMDSTDELKALARSEGADQVGVADIEALKSEPNPMPPGALDRYVNAVSVAVRLNDAIVDTIHGGPTPEYIRHFRAVNVKLDNLTARLAQWVEQQGFAALPIPASVFVDPINLLGSIPHRAVARMAGIGWQGKSLMLISPEHGPRIRLGTVFTTMPLRLDGPIPNRCGSCIECVKACPASAIKNIGTRDRYATRDGALDFDRCAEKSYQFKADPTIDAPACGVCVQVCPYGKRHGKPASQTNNSASK